MGSSYAEWDLLKAIAAARNAEPGDAEAVALFSDDLDHGHLLNLALRNRLGPCLASWLLRHDLVERVPHRYGRVLEDLRVYHRHRQRTLTAEAARICAGLDARGVRYALTKGIPLQAELYPEPGVRELNDIDVMTGAADGKAVEGALVELGYSTRKEYDYRTDALVDLPRKDLLVYSVSPDHLPHLVRLGDGGAVPYIAVDVALSLSWHGSEWEVPVETALESVRRVGLPGSVGTVPAFGHPYAFAFIVLHLFREGWFQRTAEGKDINLSQFTDVARYWRSMDAGTRAEVRSLVAQHGIGAPTAWVAHHTDALFGTDVVSGLDVRALATPDWIASGRGRRGAELAWSGDIDERLTRGLSWLDPVDAGTGHGADAGT